VALHLLYRLAEIPESINQAYTPGGTNCKQVAQAVNREAGLDDNQAPLVLIATVWPPVTAAYTVALTNLATETDAAG